MSKCSKLIGIVVAGIVLVTGMSFADVTSDYIAAGELRKQGKHVEAQAAFEKVLKDYPDAPVDTLAGSQWYVGYSLYDQRKFPEAIIELTKVIQNYPEATQKLLILAQGLIGSSYWNQGNFPEAQVAWEKVLNTYPNAPINVLAPKQLYVGKALVNQEKSKEANSAFIKALLLYAQVKDVKVETLISTFGLINPSLMTADEYKVVLQDAIKATPATEANAPFLGRIKSELEKMK